MSVRTWHSIAPAWNTFPMPRMSITTGLAWACMARLRHEGGGETSLSLTMPVVVEHEEAAPGKRPTLPERHNESSRRNRQAARHAGLLLTCTPCHRRWTHACLDEQPPLVSPARPGTGQADRGHRLEAHVDGTDRQLARGVAARPGADASRGRAHGHVSRHGA